MKAIRDSEDFVKAFKETVDLMYTDGGVDNLEDQLGKTTESRVKYVQQVIDILTNDKPSVDYVWGVAMGMNDFLIKWEEVIPPTFADWDEVVELTMQCLGFKA